MPSNHLILCHPLLLLPSIFPSIRVFSNEPVLHIRWPKYWSFSFSISPSDEYSGLISFVYIWPIILLLFPHLTYPRTLPNMRAQLFFLRWTAAQRSMGSHISITYYGVVPPPFWPPRSISVHMKCLSCSKNRKYIWPPDPLLKWGLALVCSCHDCYFKASTEDKVWLFYPVSIVTSILESRQEDGYKYLTWSPPSPSFKRGEQEASFKCLAWSPLFSCPKKCKQEASCKCLACGSSASCLTTGWIVSLQIKVFKTQPTFRLLQWLSGKEFAYRIGDPGDVGSVPWLGRSRGGRNGNPLQYFCLKNTIQRRAWWKTVHRVAKSWTKLKQLGTYAHITLFTPEGALFGDRVFMEEIEL